MCHSVNDGSHSFTRHPHVYPRMELAILHLLPAAKHHRILAGTHFCPTQAKRLSWPRWLVAYRGSMPSQRRSHIPVLTDRLCGVRRSNSRPLSRKSDALTTTLPSHHCHTIKVISDKDIGNSCTNTPPDGAIGHQTS